MSFDHSARLEAHFDATPERVWHAFTDPDALAAWYWPASVRPRVTSDPRPGGHFGITAGGNAADGGRSGGREEVGDQ
jgi:uncharacterized protein YndB with AHSA1/START domain